MRKLNQIAIALLMTMSSLVAPAEELYVNAKTGNDKNTGSQSQPLKTIAEAAHRIDASAAKEATTIILSEGVYPLTETALLPTINFLWKTG